MRTLFALFIGMCILAPAAWGDTPIYKWVDAQGVVHYSTEPHSSDAKQLPIVNSGSLPNPSTAPAAASATSSAAADTGLVTPTQADSPACKAGRDRLFKYLHADSLYQVDDKGQKQKLSVQDMQKALDDARDYVRQACGPGGQ
ncbi:MAG TPA: DUF4124 domain-containing protein [Gammaproteobacteria bacterium]|jgi:hypothetical protein|nr:DUF4124 domain-containing protein [Gammaproteobacteria bacterium]